MSERPQISETSRRASALIALGGNLPWQDIAPDALIPKVLDALEGEEIHVAARSSLWRTPAWPDPTAPRYVNAAARIETSLHPDALLARLHDVERRFGRERGAINRSRTLDLDIIDYEGRVVSSGLLSLPHPRATRRAFVLLPLREVAPGWRDPVTGAAIEALIGTLPPDDISGCIRLR